MNLQEKIAVATKAVLSISRHDDEDADVRRAALDELSSVMDDERLAITRRVRARIEALALAPPATTEG